MTGVQQTIIFPPLFNEREVSNVSFLKERTSYLSNIFYDVFFICFFVAGSKSTTDVSLITNGKEQRFVFHLRVNKSREVIMQKLDVKQPANLSDSNDVIKNNKCV